MKDYINDFKEEAQRKDLRLREQSLLDMNRKLQEKYKGVIRYNKLVDLFKIIKKYSIEALRLRLFLEDARQSGMFTQDLIKSKEMDVGII